MTDRLEKTINRYCPECRKYTSFRLSVVRPNSDGSQTAAYVCPGCARPPRKGMKSTAIVRDENNRVIDQFPSTGN